MRKSNRRNAGVLTADLPLFASSWVALFVLLRRNWRRGDADPRAATFSPKTGPNIRPQ